MSRLFIAVGLLGLVVGSYWLTYQAGLRAGRNDVLAQWYSDRVQQEKAHSEALAASGEEIRRQVAAREEVERGLTEKLAAADARGRDLADRLRDALEPARTCSVPAAGPAPIPADGTTRKPADPPAIGRALASHLAACERDAERLGELQRYYQTVLH